MAEGGNPLAQDSELFEPRVRYWIEARMDAKSPWVTWFESDDEEAMREQFARLQQQYPSARRDWRLGRTTTTSEVLDVK